MTASLTLEAMLGGRRGVPAKPRTPLQWVTVIRQVIPSAAVDSLTQVMGITQAELAAALAIPDRTLARREKEGRLNSEETANWSALPGSSNARKQLSRTSTPRGTG